MQQCRLIIFSNFYCIVSCCLNLFSCQICFFVCIYYSSCICILLYIHVTVLYYVQASFQKINVKVNVNDDDCQDYVYDFLGSIDDLESNSRKVVSKVPLLKINGPRGTN